MENNKVVFYITFYIEERKSAILRYQNKIFDFREKIKEFDDGDFYNPLIEKYKSFIKNQEELIEDAIKDFREIVGYDYIDADDLPY